MAVILCKNCGYTVFPPGTRVRHHSDQYTEAYVKGTATVVDHNVHDGHLEYHVLRDKALRWGSRHGWWPWNAVLRVDLVWADEVMDERAFGNRRMCPDCPHAIVAHDPEYGCAWCACARWTAGEPYPWEKDVEDLVQ